MPGQTPPCHSNGNSDIPSTNNPRQTSPHHPTTDLPDTTAGQRGIATHSASSASQRPSTTASHANHTGHRPESAPKRATISVTPHHTFVPAPSDKAPTVRGSPVSQIIVTPSGYEPSFNFSPDRSANFQNLQTPTQSPPPIQGAWSSPDTSGSGLRERIQASGGAGMAKEKRHPSRPSATA